MNKKSLSERDICTKFITPALERAGWDSATQIREEFPLTKGRIIVRGKLHTRAQRKRADYVLFYKPNLPIAVIEAKDANHSLGDGMQQGLCYAEMLQVPFVFSSNGEGFLFHNKIAADGVIERELGLDEFPSADTLWQWWATHLGLSGAQSELVTQDFLAPYKVVRIDLDKDLAGWRPDKGMVGKHGNEIEDRIYNQRDFDKTLVLEKRTQLVAKKISEFLKQTNRFDKTIVFCDNIDHAERMRQALTNENADLVAKNHKYVMRITGDNEEGKAELDNFIFPESKYPVIATTSKLMTTGIDAQTCKLIVLDQRIQSMTEFKQIIGRGTRINEDYGKYYFTIIDFKKATELFADPDFDGNPVQIYEPQPGESPVPPDVLEGENPDDGGFTYPLAGENPEWTGVSEPSPGVRRYVVANVEVKVASERVQYFDANGKLITESLKDYTRKTLVKEFASLDDFLRRWSSAEKNRPSSTHWPTKGSSLKRWLTKSFLTTILSTTVIRQ